MFLRPCKALPPRFYLLRYAANALLSRSLLCASAVLIFGVSAAFGQTPSPRSTSPAQSNPISLARHNSPHSVASSFPAAPSALPTSVEPHTIELTVPQATPLRVVIRKALPIRKVGEPVRAQITDPIYAFDRLVVPKGSELDGRIVQLVHRSILRKIASYANADFSPHRAVRVEFDTLILPDGRRMAVHTRVLQNAAPMLKLETNPSSNGIAHRARGLIGSQWHALISEIRPSAVWNHTKSFVESEWPYHKQKIPAGSVFVAELEQSLDFGSAIIPKSEMGSMGKMPVLNTVAYARLLTPLSSASTHVGASAKAVLTRPIFSADHKLLLPVGTQLEGTVVRAKPARRLHRNGQLHFQLSRVKLPSSAPQPVELALEGIEVPQSSNVQVDSEGVTHVASHTESRVLRTAFSVGIANSTLDSDSGHAGATARSENRPLGGASGYKLIGFALSFAAGSPVLSRVLGFWGAGESVYFHFITRGQDLVLPRGTPMEISFGEPRIHRAPERPRKTMPTASAPRAAALK